MSNQIPILSMPWVVQKVIFQKMNWETKCSLRRCSKRMLRKVNEFEPNFYRSIRISIDEEQVLMVLISNADRGRVIGFPGRSEPENGCKGKPIKDYIERAVVDLTGIVANPRVTVRKLCVEFGESTSGVLETPEAFARGCAERLRRKRSTLCAIRDRMKALGEQMNVEHFELLEDTAEEDILTLLGVFRPGVLRHIAIKHSNETIDKVSLTEQWKRAKSVFVSNSSYSHILPLECLAHFPEVHLRNRLLRKNDIDKILLAALRQGDNFVKFVIRPCTALKDAQEYVKQLKNRVDWPGNRRLYVEICDCLADVQFSVSRERDFEQ